MIQLRFRSATESGFFRSRTHLAAYIRHVATEPSELFPVNKLDVWQPAHTASPVESNGVRSTAVFVALVKCELAVLSLQIKDRHRSHTRGHDPAGRVAESTVQPQVHFPYHINAGLIARNAEDSVCKFAVCSLNASG